MHPTRSAHPPAAAARAHLLTAVGILVALLGAFMAAMAALLLAGDDSFGGDPGQRLAAGATAAGLGLAGIAMGAMFLGAARARPPAPRLAGSASPLRHAAGTERLSFGLTLAGLPALVALGVASFYVPWHTPAVGYALAATLFGMAASAGAGVVVESRAR